MDKSKALQEIAEEIAHCKECQQHTIGKPVPGEGNPDAKVVFVGEAPGRQEAETGRPFIGRSGKLLRQSIEEIGLRQDDIFITSIGKYLPKSGTPTMAQISHGRIHVLKQLATIQPKVVVLLGSVAAQGVLGEKIPVMKVHGTTQEKGGIVYFLTIHPAAALRFPPLRKIFLDDFTMLKRVLHNKNLL